MITDEVWTHVVENHPEMDSELEEVCETLRYPNLVVDDPRPGRQRYFQRYRANLWLRVVVEFAGDKDRLITAFFQTNEPEEHQRTW